MSDPSRWIDWLPDDVRSAVLSNLTETHAPTGTKIYSFREPPVAAYQIFSGRVRLYSSAENGRELLLQVYEPGEMVGLLACVDGKGYAFDAKAECDCSLGVLAREKLVELRAQFPIVETALLRAVSNMAFSAFRLYNETLAYPLSVRIAARLRRMYKAARLRGDPAGRLRMSQGDLASSMGASRQAVNLELARMQREGIVAVSYGAISILDPARLRAISSR